MHNKWDLMSNKRRMTVSLPESVYDKLQKMAGSERKIGETITKLVEDASDLGTVSDGLDVETLRWQIVGLASDVKGIESRQLQTEKTLAAIIAKCQLDIP